jgi:hypothetical protein
MSQVSPKADEILRRASAGSFSAPLELRELISGYENRIAELEAARTGPSEVEALANRICAEVRRAREKFPEWGSAHHGYAVILEELDELWDAIRAHRPDQAYREAEQVAAMAMRFILDTERFQ